MSKWITPLTCAVLGATAALPFIARLDGPPPPMRAGREPDMLVGRWQTNVAPDEAARQAGEREFEDVLIFTRGQTFESEACRKFGFKPCEYEYDARGVGITRWSAKPQSESSGHTHWQGTVSGNEIQGEMTWTKPDNAELRYSFQGKRAAE
jgi:hypothetical protein